MSLINKKADMTPFNMYKKPRAQSALLMPVILGASWLMTRKFKLKIDKSAVKNLKPPYIVLSMHQGFSDYYIAPLSLFPHRADYVSDMEGFAAFGEHIYRAIGCIGKRRYMPDISVMQNIRYALKKNRIVVLFPESRHSNAGTTSLVPDNMARLCKMLKVPVVVLQIHGSYLANPFWDEENTRKSKISARLECICDAEKIENISTDELQQKIYDSLQYDEYSYQLSNKIKIDDENRANGLHLPLYRCEKCHAKYRMKSYGTALECEKCGAKWLLSEYGELICDNEKSSVPMWYENERKSVIEEIEKGEYNADFSVEIEALPNSQGFVNMGVGRLVQDENGFELTFENKDKICFSAKTMESVQTEYNYRQKGSCIVLSTKDCCYYAYCKTDNFNVTEIQFAAEYFHKKVIVNNKKHFLI